MIVINPPNVNLSQIVVDSGLDLSGGDYDILMKAARTVDGKDVSAIPDGDMLKSVYDPCTLEHPPEFLSFPHFLSMANLSVVAGTWAESADAGQTIFHKRFVSAAAYYVNSTKNDADEFKQSNVKLRAGKYKIECIVTTHNESAILEVLHGASSAGTADLYDAGGPTFNQVATYYLSLGSTTTADLRFKASGKNGASSNYAIRISSIEITEVKET